MANYTSSHTGAEIDSAVGRTKDTVVTAGTVAASSAVVVDANKDISGFRNVTLTGQIQAATINLTGDTTIGDGDTDNITINADVNSNIIPNTDNTFDLGSSSKQWKDLYVNGIGYIDQLGTDADPIAIYASSGEIDGTAIGSESASTGAFTSLTASGTSTFNGTVDINNTSDFGSNAMTNVNIDSGTINGTTITSSVDIVIDTAGKGLADEFGNNILERTAGGYITIGDSAWNEVRLNTTGSTDFVLDNSGRVGINVTSPEDKLHIAGTSASVSDTQLVLEGRYGGYGAGINFVSRTSSGGTNVSMAKITADGEAAFNTTTANQDAGLRFFTTLNGSSAEKMRINASGAVTVTASSGDDTGITFVTDRSGDGTLIHTTSYKADNSASQETSYADIRANIVDESDGTEDGSITFRTMKAGTMTEHITLESDGPVKSVGGIYFTGNSLAGADTGVSSNGHGGDLRFYVNGTNHMILSESSSNAFLNINNNDTGSAGSNLKQLSLGDSDSTYWDTTNSGTFTGAIISNSNDTAGTACGIAFSTRASSSGISYIVSRNEGSDASSLHLGTRGTDGVARRVLVGADGAVYIDANSNNKASLNIQGTGSGQAPNDAKCYVSKNSSNDWSFLSLAGADDYGFKTKGVGNHAIVVTNHTSDTNVFRVEYDGDILASNTSISSISDRRLKKEITSASSQWDDIKALNFVNYKWKQSTGMDDSVKYLGLIADEVESVSPNLIKINAQSKEDIEAGVEDPEYKTVKYSIVWMKAVKALQEAMAKIETLEAKVEALENA